jgi:hypothetical protein
MSDERSDALVFFGATGDLAYKKISGFKVGARSTTRRAPSATWSRIICSRS